MDQRIGFMQGRLVDQIDGKIQAFPWQEWKLEFPRATKLGLKKMEWTIDDERFFENPFVTKEGQDKILQLQRKFNLSVPSVTGDCFMQNPFWKSCGRDQELLLRKLDLVIDSASVLGTQFIVMPLVDNGSIDTLEQAEALRTSLLSRTETDFSPDDYQSFISEFPDDVFNINYDIGNSASLDFNPTDELEAYGSRIVNVHVKDRISGGSTVPLGTGSAKFDIVFASLRKQRYTGNYILQTARAKNKDHAKVLAEYAQFTSRYLEI
jgi:hexulose-6-phosphate isomerase